MAEKNNSYCSICGKPYYLCVSCKSAMTLSPWKLHTDTSEHYKIYQILHGVSTGVYSKEEAKEKLQMVDLSEINTFKERVKKRINDIMKDNVVDVEKVETIEEVVEQPVEVKTKKVVRKKRYKTVETE